MPSVVIASGRTYTPAELDEAARIVRALGRGDLVLAGQAKR